MHGFVSKPEIQKLNRNSIYVFVNGRLIRDRLIQHAILEAYRNILPPTVYPVVLLFLECRAAEVDVNVHPSKTEVRFRQQTVMHDFVRDSVRAALMKARPVPQFMTEISAHPTASLSLTPGARGGGGGMAGGARASRRRSRCRRRFPAVYGEASIRRGDMSSKPTPRCRSRSCRRHFPYRWLCSAGGGRAGRPGRSGAMLASLKPLGQIRESFILAVNHEGLWIIDQHVAHERVLFERVLKQRAAQKVESQRLLMPLLIELSPAQQAVFCRDFG